MHSIGIGTLSLFGVSLILKFFSCEKCRLLDVLYLHGVGRRIRVRIILFARAPASLESP